MTAAEFLALIDKHPLPWRARVNSCDALVYGSDAIGDVLPQNDVHAIADAAPALAAAAIRLLRKEPWVTWAGSAGLIVCVACDAESPAHGPSCEWLALRAALPPGLR